MTAVVHPLEKRISPACSLNHNAASATSPSWRGLCSSWLLFTATKCNLWTVRPYDNSYGCTRSFGALASRPKLALSNTLGNGWLRLSERRTALGPPAFDGQFHGELFSNRQYLGGQLINVRQHGHEVTSNFTRSCRVLKEVVCGVFKGRDFQK